ncbi:BZIP transcription factor [Plectosphaerella plurivora]|uniref:BZIP transcription factor n=1 Tax=Plectosphaerella plurivora TaxID=936078 RepID=A0A9P8V5W2_9PEZI|nr:BZIP transcription factor [Plectosphaerella plurivora]
MPADAGSQPSPSGQANASDRASSAADLPSYNKRGPPVDGPSPAAGSPNSTDAGLPGSDPSKKRRTGPGARGVANLTPEQLAKKRANDREAQRAIRERTKNQIETLERKIQDLTSQQPYQDLQAALRAKEAVEAENADIKRRLASVISLLQPLVSSQPAPGPEVAFASPAQHYGVPHHPAPTSAANVSTPGSAASPGPSDHASPWSQGGPIEQQRRMLNQQRSEMRHSLDMGPERLGLDFLLDPALKYPKVQDGVNGAQDSPSFHHVPLKHDWTATQTNMLDNSSNSAPQRPGGEWPGERPPAQARPPPPATSAATPYAGLGKELKNTAPSCPLDSLLLDFLYERRQRAADGLSQQELIGPRYPSVSSLLNPANSRYSHPLSKVFTDILATFPDLSRLPERVAVLYIMFLVMRWQIAPTQENLDRLPSWAAPVASQFTTEHPAWIDHLPFPSMREFLVRNHASRDYLFDIFFVPFTATLSLNWPYEDTDTLLVVPDSNEVMINPVFERHLRRLENWTLGDAFAKTFPGLDGTYNLKKGGR